MRRQKNTTQSLNASRRAGLSKKNPNKNTSDVTRAEQVAESFTLLLEACGIKMYQLSYSISCDVTSFTRTFTSGLSSLSISVDQLQEEIEHHVATEDRLRASLEPLEYSGPPEHSLSNMGQPTLMRLLLDISSLQPFVISLLLTKFEEYANSIQQEEAAEITNLILSQLRWITKLAKPREFSAKILRVLGSSPSPQKRLVILCLPDIVEDSEHTFVAQQLKDLLSDTCLTAVIVDTISNFNLSPDLKEEFRDAALSMLTSVPSEDLEYLLKFILHPSHQEESDDVVSHVRSSGIFIATRGADTNAVVIRALESVLRFQPLIFESWLRFIEQSPSSGVRAVDLCVLCIMCSMSSAQLRAQNALKIKLKQGINIECILEDLSIISHCLSRYTTAFFALFQAPLLSNDFNFTLSLLQSLFLEAGQSEKQSIIDFALQTLCLDTQLDPLPPLSLLSSLAESDRDSLAPFVSDLQALYTELHTIPRHNIVKFFELTACLTLRSNDSEHYIDDTFHEAVNSLLSSGDESVRNVGVMGVAVGIRLLLAEYSSNLTESQLRTLTRPILQLKQLLSSHPASLALFYSELAGVVRISHRNNEFLLWVITGLEKEFAREFMLELSGGDFNQISSLKPCLIFGLNTSVPRVALNLLSLVHGLQVNKLDRTRDSRSLSSLLPQLQLMSVCSQLLNGNLRKIEHILAAPVLLIQQDELAKLDQLSTENSHLIVSSLLFLSAWLCELINVYSAVAEGGSHSPAYQCLSQLILVERLLHKFGAQLASLPKYLSQPLLQAVTATHSEHLLQPTHGIHQKHRHSFVEKVKTSSDKQQVNFVPTPLYDQLTLQSLMLVQFDTHCNEIRESSSEEFWNKLPINLDECTFLFRALKHKLDKHIPAKQFGFHTQSNRKPASNNQFLTTVCDILPHLCSYLELIDKTDDGLMETSENDFQTQNEIEFVFLLFSCLETIFHLISCNDDLDRFDIILKEIANHFKVNSDQVLLGREELIINSIAYLNSLLFRGNTFTFVQPVCKIFSHISLLHQKPRIRQTISESLEKILKHEWPHYVSNKASFFEEIVRLYVHFHESPLLAIEEIAGTAVPELLLDNSNKSKLFPTLNSSTMYIFYKVVFSELVNDLKTLQERPFQASDPMDLQLQRLFKLEISVRLFSILVNIVKSFDGRLFLGTALRSSRFYIESFLKLGMPLLDFIFRDKNAEVTNLLKSLQQGTRCLQHYCTHSKNLKDVSLTRYVPPLRKSLEMFLFRVKAMLGANNCTDAFTIGNLKNKNIHGDVIQSQSLDKSLDSIQTDI